MSKTTKLNKKNKYLQLSQRQRMSPFPNYMSMECVCKEMKNVFGYAYNEDIIIFQGNNFYNYMDKDDHARVGKGTLKKVLKQPDIFLKLLLKLKKFEKSFYKFLHTNNKPANLAKYSDLKLTKLHQEFEKRYKQVYSHYFPILSIEIYFFEYLREYIFKLEPDRIQAAKYIDILITERKAMVATQEKMSALKVCQTIKNNKKWSNIFKQKSIDLVLESINKNSDIKRLFKNHVNKFFWITRDYDDPVLEPEDFVKRFKKHLRRDPAKELAKMENEEKKLQSDIRNIIKKLKIDKKHARLFQTMREGIHYKEYRKWIVSKSLYYYDPILKEIAKRGGLTLRQARFLLTSEVVDMLLNQKDYSKELSERLNLSVYHVIKGKTFVYTKNQAKEYTKHLVKINPKLKVLECEPVSSGVARGPAKIMINPDSFHKMKPGDIIITLQATPVFSHVLEIAGGLICDGGPGITSHPATLAREAGIPGVIKARMATKILKDGEIVEVDGNEGKVTRISK